MPGVEMLVGLFGEGWWEYKFGGQGVRGDPESICTDPSSIVLKYNAFTQVCELVNFKFICCT